MSDNKTTKKIATTREKKYFNNLRLIFQFFVTKFLYMIRFKTIYRLEVYGKENIPDNNQYLVAANHLSTLDPPLVASVLPHPVSFMAKKELFEIPIMRLWFNWLGAFAVDRNNLNVSTIKTALTVSKTKNWVLGIFPQGTRQEKGTISGITKGFVSIARTTKCGVLPIGITGTEEAKHIPLTGKIIVRIGKLIPYSNDLELMEKQWIDQIQELTGFTYSS